LKDQEGRVVIAPLEHPDLAGLLPVNEESAHFLRVAQMTFQKEPHFRFLIGA